LIIAALPQNANLEVRAPQIALENPSKLSCITLKINESPEFLSTACHKLNGKNKNRMTHQPNT
jgi:hypothetical protein